MKSYSTLPQGLYQSRPRHVRLSWPGRVIATLALALCVGAPAVAMALHRQALRERAEQMALLEHGVLTDGVITRLKRESKDSKRASVYYRFDANGRSFEDHTKLPIARWRELRQGYPLPVRYLAANPSVSSPDGVARGAMPVAIAYLISVVMLAGGVVCWLVLAFQRRLLSDGRAAMAVIKSTKKKRTQHGSYWHVVYEFPLLNGSKQTGSTQTGKAPEVASSIAVLYDADNPRRSRPYPLSLVRLGSD
jgi:hypothetical protein